MKLVREAALIVLRQPVRISCCSGISAKDISAFFRARCPITGSFPYSPSSDSENPVLRQPPQRPEERTIERVSSPDDRSRADKHNRLLQAYAAGEASRLDLRSRGITDCIEVRSRSPLSIVEAYMLRTPATSSSR